MGNWPFEYQLHDANDRLISKIVYPGTFWDHTLDIYDCLHRKMGSLKLPFDWKNLFTNAYAEHQVFDGEGNHIANLVQEDLTKTFFGSRQRIISLKDLNGGSMVSMRHPSGGWRLNPFGEYFDVYVELQTAQAIVPAMNPEFLSLVFANALAAESRFGPYTSFIVYFVLVI